MRLREATAGDLYRFHLIERSPGDGTEPWIAEVEAFFTRDAGFWLRGDPGADRHLVVVEDADGEMVVAAAWELIEGAAYIAGMLLEHRHRGGRGPRFLDLVLDEIAGAAVGATVWWLVDPRNTVMMKLSERATGQAGHERKGSPYLRFELAP